MSETTTDTETADTDPTAPVAPDAVLALSDDVAAAIERLATLAADGRRNEPVPVLQKLGGRKFIGALAFTVLFVVLDLLRTPLTPATQDVLLWIYVAFVGGNAAVHATRKEPK
jgi:hypothetical protein